jgi:CBS domain-containing protein
MRKVKQILAAKSRNVWSIEPDATVYDAIHQLAEKEIGALLVMENDKLVGVISERDYARQIILRDKSSRGTLVREIMTTDVVTTDPEEDIAACMGMMTERRIRHLPVMEKGRVVGVLSIGDLIRAIIAEQQSTIDDLAKYITG